MDIAAGEREAVTISERCAKRILKVTSPQFVCHARCAAASVVQCSLGLLSTSKGTLDHETRVSHAQVQPEGYLRLRVDGGGCSGFQYKFELDTEDQEDDIVFEKSGAKLVIDETSLDLVRGSTIDFVEEMISSSFQVVNNPNSESNCGCGASFAPKM